MAPPRRPPCHSCPKAKLFPNPEEPGLDPRNSLAVHIYRLAARDIRAGDSAVLIGTISIPDAIQVMDEHTEHFPTALSRQETLTLLKVLDRVALEVRGPDEAEQRKRAMEEAKRETGQTSRNVRLKK